MNKTFKPLWYYERGALRVRFDGLEVICPDIGLPLKRMAEITLKHCQESGYLK